MADQVLEGHLYVYCDNDGFFLPTLYPQVKPADGRDCQWRFSGTEVAQAIGKRWANDYSAGRDDLKARRVRITVESLS